MRYELTTPIDVIAKAAHLFEDHFRESGQTDKTLKVDYAFYKALTDYSDSFGLLVYEQEEVVGYAVIAVVTHPFQMEKYASNEAIYVVPRVRQTGTGGQLIVRCEREAKRRGCSSFDWSGLVDGPLHKLLVKRPQYRQLYVHMEKQL